MCLAFSPKPRKAQAFCFTITLNENVKLIWYISVQPENGSWSAPLANSHPEARGTCWPQSCNIYVFQTQTGASWPEKTNVPMETWRDSLRKPRIYEQSFWVTRMKGIWKRTQYPTEPVRVLWCAHFLLLFYIPSCFQSLLQNYSWGWIYPEDSNVFILLTF